MSEVEREARADQLRNLLDRLTDPDLTLQESKELRVRLAGLLDSRAKAGSSIRCCSAA